MYNSVFVFKKRSANYLFAASADIHFRLHFRKDFASTVSGDNKGKFAVLAAENRRGIYLFQCRQSERTKQLRVFSFVENYSG